MGEAIGLLHCESGDSRAGITNNFVSSTRPGALDLDKELAKLKNVTSHFVQQPTTQPWGNRSLLFRDPDGNLINCFTPVSAQAIQKFSNYAR